jgi:hypothetical protein
MNAKRPPPGMGEGLSLYSAIRARLGPVSLAHTDAYAPLSRPRQKEDEPAKKAEKELCGHAQGPDAARDRVC